MLDGLSDDQVNQYLEEHPKIVPLFEVDIAEAVTLYVVVKFPAHSEKPEDVRRIGGVQCVHSPLYKCSIEVRGAFMALNSNNLVIENAACNGIYPTFSRDPHLVQ